ncbi:alpha-mannosidase [Lacticaseibacillus pabuli]|uniref:Alpha-mannosidase n=1 Tax=Lacticaseibacillus pabuli TaxID=3025672 RepID=A0ABY7WSN0_9LACO|nr:alpha-mannosidase [Lacticaseibacillus sp. KACC 23028]WDF83190.1 alpha-mannosidase [Lacticaseibacillus sp. KACC 23028]
MATAHLVQHTHWDREWYFTDMDAQILSDSLFTEAITELEHEPQDSFTLDGQSSIVDEFVATHPDMLARIQALVKAGRLFVGPWYTQTDAVNVDPESILRNAIIGQLETKQKYGAPMQVGYLPDTFGYNANLPALLTHVGLNRFIFWRGMNYDTMVKSPYFKWVAPGGASVTAVNLPPTGYSAAHMTDVVKHHVTDYVQKRLDPTTKFVTDIRGDKIALLPVGMDQMNMVHDFPELLDQLNAVSVNDNVQSTYPAFFDALKDVDLPTYAGEIRDPVYARVHRSIGSVRTDLKLDNARAEIKILRRLEPLMVIAAHNHIHVSTTMLAQVWKIVMECQAHDSLGGSVTDNVAIDIAHRFKQADELIDGIENLIKYKLAEILKLNDHQLLLFNTAAHAFTGHKTFSVFSATPNVQFKGMTELELLKRVETPARANVQERTATGIETITEPKYYELTYRARVTLPALGYKVFSFAETTVDAVLTSAERGTIAMGKMGAELSEGRIKLRGGDGHEYLLSLLDSANDGDTYDYSPLAGDEERVLPFDAATVAQSDYTQTASFTGTAELPVDLTSRNLADGATRAVDYELTLTLGLLDGTFTGRISVDNTVDSHRMRLAIQDVQGGTYTIQQIQDAFVATPVRKIPADWAQHFVEKPVNIFAFNKTVSLVGKASSELSLISNDLHEFEPADGQMYITLFASTGQLGKPDLAWRPGRASGDTTSRGHIMMATPLAQTRGHLTFDFALRLSSQFHLGDLVQTADQYLQPTVAYQRQSFNLFANRLDNKIWPEDTDQILPDEQSIFELPADINVAAIYPAFTATHHFIVRVVNLTNQPQQLPERLKSVQQVNGLEETVPATDTIGAYGIASFMLADDPQQ